MSRPVGGVRLRPSWLLRVTENSASTRRLNSSKPSLSMMNFIRALWRFFQLAKVLQNLRSGAQGGGGAPHGRGRWGRRGSWGGGRDAPSAPCGEERVLGACLRGPKPWGRG